MTWPLDSGTNRIDAPANEKTDYGAVQYQFNGRRGEQWPGNARNLTNAGATLTVAQVQSIPLGVAMAISVDPTATPHVLELYKGRRAYVELELRDGNQRVFHANNRWARVYIDEWFTDLRVQMGLAPYDPTALHSAVFCLPNPADETWADILTAKQPTQLRTRLFVPEVGEARYRRAIVNLNNFSI